MKTWLIGEQNPYSRGHEYDLYPFPENASGDRLRKILGITVDEYLERFERRNLLHKGEKWGVKTAKAAADAVLAKAAGARLVLLGAKVTKAFGHEFKPFHLCFGVDYDNGVSHRSLNPYALILPHPSGLSRAWNDIDAVQKARDALVALEAE